MKFPSLFKVPSNQRFNYMPRYYDEIKEDIENRTKRIRRELELEGVLKPESASENSEEQYQSRITGSFSKRAYYKSTRNRSAILQFIIFAVLISLVGGYLYIGNDIFYVALLGIPAYLYFRLKKRS